MIGYEDPYTASDTVRNVARSHQNLDLSFLYSDILHSILPPSSAGSHGFDHWVVRHGYTDRISAVQAIGL